MLVIAAALLLAFVGGTAFVVSHVVSSVHGHHRAEVLTFRNGLGTEIGAEGPPLSQLPPMLGDLQWSPDGSTLAFVSGRIASDIFVFNSGGNVRQVTDTLDRVEGWPRWSPDGKLLAFSSQASHGLQDETPDGGQLAMMNADGSEYRVVGQGPMRWPPSWSEDGRRIAYGSEGHIFVYDLTTSATTSYSAREFGLPDATYADAPSWSPTTNRMVVEFSDSSVVQEATTEGYALVNFDTLHANILLQYQAPFLPSQPAAWSPSGDRIVINLISSSKYGNPNGLWLVDPSGQGLQKVDDVVAYQVRWAPSGKSIAYIDNNTRQVYLLDPDTLRTTYQPAPQNPVENIAWRPGSR